MHKIQLPVQIATEDTDTVANYLDSVCHVAKKAINEDGAKKVRGAKQKK